jgi:hypothetical protein
LSDTNLVLEHLRAIRGQMATLTDAVQDVSRRLTRVEIEVGRLRASALINHGNTMLRLGGFEQRLARIERRLEIADAAS